MRTRAVAALALLAVAALVVLTAVAGLRWWSADEAADAQRPAPAPASGPATTFTTSPPATSPAQTPRPARLAPVVRRAPAAPPPVRKAPPPVQVQLPDVDIDARLRPVGVQADGQMELPEQPWVLGWYRFGPAPGSGTGSVVLAGHIDSRRYGLGPLARLRQSEVGDTVEVTTGQRTTATYRVVRVDRYDQQRLPDELFDRTGPERLRVITCGGAYDPETGYEENLVVTAVPV